MLSDVKEGAGDTDENVSKVGASVLGETAESAPKERRNCPGRHAELAAFGGETE